MAPRERAAACRLPVVLRHYLCAATLDARPEPAGVSGDGAFVHTDDDRMLRRFRAFPGGRSTIWLASTAGCTRWPSAINDSGIAGVRLVARHGVPIVAHGHRRI